MGTAKATKSPGGWLLTPTFDATLLLGTVVLGLIFVAIAGSFPIDINTLILVDTAILGYPHVIATFSRVDQRNLGARDTAVLFGALPLAVLGGVLAIGLGLGEGALATVFFYWQSFHYIRQSYGISRMYQRKAPGLAEGDPSANAVIYLVGFSGVLFRSYQQWPNLLGMDLRLIPVPQAVAVAGGCAAAGAVLWWGLETWRRAQAGELALAHTLYVAFHIVVFGLGYWLVRDNGQGWLLINVWHNAQYLLVVWLYHHLRLGDRGDKKRPFLSMLARRENFLRFFGVCFVVAWAVYGLLDRLTAGASFLTILIVYQTINFHHYLVDGLLWKLRRPKLQRELKLAA